MSPLCADGLGKLGINTIFDLGAAQLFAGATLIAASQSSDSLVGRFGLVPTDRVTDASRLLPLPELADAPINTLRGKSTTLADEFAKTMAITTAHDLASRPP